MEKFGFLFFLLILALVESAVPIHLVLIAVLVLANFSQLRSIIWWTFTIGLVLDLAVGNILGINSLILILTILIFNLTKSLAWANINYELFPKQTVVITVFQVIIASRFYNLFYNLLNSGVFVFDFQLQQIPPEIILILIFFPLISFLSLHLVPKKQLELKF